MRQNERKTKTKCLGKKRIGRERCQRQKRGDIGGNQEETK